jgi:hypothetical protein
MDTDVLYDMDAVPSELTTRRMIRDIEVFTQELQLSGSAKNLEWVGGIFYLEEVATTFQDDIRMLNAFTEAYISPNNLEHGQLVERTRRRATRFSGRPPIPLTTPRVELGRMKYPCVRSRCIAYEASGPSRTVEEAQFRQAELGREQLGIEGGLTVYDSDRRCGRRTDRGSALVLSD